MGEIINGLYQIEYCVDNDAVVIYLFIRQLDGTKVIKKITNFLPYCYIDKNVNVTVHPGIVSVDNKDYRTLFGDIVKKIIPPDYKKQQQIDLNNIQELKRILKKTEIRLGVKIENSLKLK